jgi:replicative DNA helicase
MNLRRKSVDTEIEEKILVGLIVSDSFCRDIKSLIRKDSFQVPYIQTISRWVLSYYDKYLKAPQGYIQDIFNVEKNKLTEEYRELISSFLTRLSKDFENDNFNADYLKDKAILFLKKQSLKATSEKIQALIALDKISEAEQEMEKYKKISKETSKWVNPSADETINNYFEDVARNKNRLFQLPGMLGELIGPFERNWFMAFLAPVKKGKSFFLQEIAVQAFLEKYKVVYVSLEMDIFRVLNRLFKRVMAQAEENAIFIYPCFDCLRNQNNTCRKSERVNNKNGLLNIDGNKPEYSPSIKYRPCTACRGKGTKDYITETWFTTYKRDKLKLKHLKKTVGGLTKMYGDNLRVISYPAFSANLSEIRTAIDNLEYNEGFVPDVIVIDYADILAPEDSRLLGRERSDETWKMLKHMADSRHCLVVSASQSNRQSFDKKNVTQTDISEDIRKVAHVDMMLALNQTPEEKDAGVVRVSVIAGRDMDFNQFKSCTVLQQLSLGQVILDSDFEYTEKKQDEV